MKIMLDASNSGYWKVYSSVTSWHSMDEYASDEEVQEWLNMGNAPDPEFTQEEIAIQFESQKLAKYNAIDVHYESMYTPADVSGTPWHGTFTSIMKIKSVIDMAQVAGMPEVTLFDYNDMPHVMSIADATNLVMQLGALYQTKFAKKKAAQMQIMAATTQAELESITW